MSEVPPRSRCGVQGEGELRALLLDCVATRAMAGGLLTPIVGGLSNRAWRLDAQGEAWFVRRGHPDAERLGVDRRSECLVLQAVAAAGLGPAVVACEPATGLLVTRFIAGTPWQATDVQTARNLRRLAECLCRLHELPVPAGIREVDYARQARHLAAGLAGSSDEAAILHARAVRAFARIADRALAPTLCHNDLHHLNLLDDGARLWLVDWEYGGRGNPLLDVAGFLALHDLGPDATAVFLEAYGRLQPADLGCLDEARWVFDYVQWLWYRLRFPGPADDENWYADRLAQRLLRCNN